MKAGHCAVAEGQNLSIPANSSQTERRGIVSSIMSRVAPAIVIVCDAAGSAICR